MKGTFSKLRELKKEPFNDCNNGAHLQDGWVSWWAQIQNQNRGRMTSSQTRTSFRSAGRWAVSSIAPGQITIQASKTGREKQQTADIAAITLWNWGHEITTPSQCKGCKKCRAKVLHKTACTEGVEPLKWVTQGLLLLKWNSNHNLSIDDNTHPVNSYSVCLEL